MSHLTCSIASRWSGVSRYGNAVSKLAQPVGVGRERVAAAAAALGVEVEQLAGELLGRAAGARLHRLPARAAELGERRVVAAGADVARDLRELVDRHEDLVRALELEVEVVAGDAGDGLGVEAGEAREPVVLVDDDVAGAQVGEGAQEAAAAARRPLDPAAAVDQPVLGDHGELQRRGDEAVAQVGLGEDEVAGVSVVPRGPQALEVVGGALALAVLRPGDERRVAGARELLELGLGLASASARRTRRPGRGTRSAASRRCEESRSGCARVERRGDRFRRDVEVVRVGVVEGGADVVPVVAQRGLEVLVGGDRRCRRARAAGRAARGSGRRAAARRRRGGSPRPRARRSRPARGARRRARRRARSRRAAPSPSERWVKVENQRSDSISMSNSSTRTARSSVAG